MTTDSPSFISYESMGISREQGLELYARYGFHPSTAHDELMEILVQVLTRLNRIEEILEIKEQA